MELEDIETINRDDYREIILCYSPDEDKEYYRVEWTTEIQNDQAFGDEAFFDTLDEAKEFYYKIEEPKSYWGVYNENGFHWRLVK